MPDLEIEVKYRTDIPKWMFEEIIEREYSYLLKDKIDVYYKDYYFYSPGDFSHSMRLREEYKKLTLTFKEEKEDNFMREEINIPLKENKDSVDNIKKIAKNFLGKINSFFIVKRSVIYITDLIEISWYQVNHKDIFIELEWKGKENEGEKKLAQIDKTFVQLMSLLPEKVSLTREFRSLFNIYGIPLLSKD